MAKRKDPVAKARGRSTAPMKKPFPWGFAVSSFVLVLALGGILFYAAENQGVGDKSSLKYAQAQFSGLQSGTDLGSSHVEGPVSYPDQASTPPFGGNHNGVWQNCGVYTAPVANEHVVHSLEHGAVWVTYNPTTASEADVSTLKELVEKDSSYRILSPYPGLKTKVGLVAWGERLMVDSAKDPQVKQFLDLFTQGPQTRERGAACTGGTSDSGPAA